MLADGEIPLLIAEQVRTEENEMLRKIWIYMACMFFWQRTMI